jgi:hypothetical protein
LLFDLNIWIFVLSFGLAQDDEHAELFRISDFVLRVYFQFMQMTRQEAEIEMVACKDS